MQQFSPCPRIKPQTTCKAGYPLLTQLLSEAYGAFPSSAKLCVHSCQHDSPIIKLMAKLLLKI